MDNGQWEELGTLTGYVSRFDLTSYPLAVAVKISWTSKAPLIYEIVEETEAGTNAITGIKSIANEERRMKNEESDDAIYDLSGRQLSTFSSQLSILKKGIYIRGGKKITIK